MTNAQNKLIMGLGIALLLTAILFVGQYYDPQDGDRTLFIKHRATFKQIFYSPIAYHRLFPTKLSSSEILEEQYFQEFIGNGFSINSDNNSLLLATGLYQLSLTLFVCGLFSQLTQLTLSKQQLFLHFIFNFFFTTLGVFYLMLADNALTTCILLLSIFILNLLCMLYLNRFKMRKKLTPIINNTQ